jgi:hypothetical protein
MKRAVTFPEMDVDVCQPIVLSEQGNTYNQIFAVPDREARGCLWKTFSNEHYVILSKTDLPVCNYRPIFGLAMKAGEQRREACRHRASPKMSRPVRYQILTNLHMGVSS